MLNNIVRKNQYLLDAPKWLQVKWRNRAALNWFVKQHCVQLEALGAIVRIGGEVFIIPQKMPIAAATIYELPEHLKPTTTEASAAQAAA